jgi:hypothetical protein
MIGRDQRPRSGHDPLPGIFSHDLKLVAGIYDGDKGTGINEKRLHGLEFGGSP